MCVLFIHFSCLCELDAEHADGFGTQVWCKASCSMLFVSFAKNSHFIVVFINHSSLSAFIPSLGLCLQRKINPFVLLSIGSAFSVVVSIVLIDAE